MNQTATLLRRPDAFARMADLLSQVASRADHHDRTDEFVSDNFAALRGARLMSAAVPKELGGDGLDASELAPLLQRLARSCGSTALAYAMHTHVVALTAWRWRNQKAPVELLLERVLKEQITVISSGGSDWLDSSGTARRIDGGFEIDAVKGFASGVPPDELRPSSSIRLPHSIFQTSACTAPPPNMKPSANMVPRSQAGSLSARGRPRELDSGDP